MPVTELRRYVLTTLGVVYLLISLTAAALVLTGCSTLPAQRRMSALSGAALRACKQDGARCAAAKACSRAAVAATEAVQAEREAVAAERSSSGADAAALAARAEAECAQFQPEAAR